jgi:hypothetical protein
MEISDMQNRVLTGVFALTFLAGAAIGNEPAATTASVSMPNTAAQFASMQAELDRLRSQVDQISYYAGDANDQHQKGCGKGSQGSGGWFAGFDLVVVKPHFEDGVDHIQLPGSSIQLEPAYDFKATPRVWLGYRNCDGLGARLRWWNFDQSSETLSTPIGAQGTNFSHRMDVTALDMEITQLVCSGLLDVDFSFGGRYGKVDMTGNGVNLSNGNVTFGHGDFEGFGPTFALGIRVPVRRSGFALTGTLRGSVLFGSGKIAEGRVVGGTGLTEFNVVSEDDDTLAYVLESTAGVEYRRCVMGGTLAIRALMEGQVWAQAAYGDTGDNGHPFGQGPFISSIDDDLGFFGATFGVEYAK